MRSQLLVFSPAPARAIPEGEALADTQRRLLALLDEARAVLATDPTLSPATLQRVQAPLHVVLRIGFVITASAKCPSALLFQGAREGRS